VAYHAELKALGQATALESGMLALQTTLSEYARLAQEVLPAGQDVVHSLHGLQAIAAAKLTVMVVSVPQLSILSLCVFPSLAPTLPDTSPSAEGWERMRSMELPLLVRSLWRAPLIHLRAC
jgi:hypothetical protein